MSIKNLTIGDKSPEIINAVIEIPRQSQNKYEYDEKLDVFQLDRVLHSPLFYPLDYGFIPGTRSEDGDHLDVLVLTSFPLFPSCLIPVRPVGLFRMIDGGELDCKILAVAVNDPRFNEITDLKEVNKHTLKEIAHFFKEYKTLERKNVEVKGWKHKEAAMAEIKKAKLAWDKEVEK